MLICFVWALLSLVLREGFSGVNRAHLPRVGLSSQGSSIFSPFPSHGRAVWHSLSKPIKHPLEFFSSFEVISYKIFSGKLSRMAWSVNPKPETHAFQASPGYLARHCQETKQPHQANVNGTTRPGTHFPARAACSAANTTSSFKSTHLSHPQDCGASALCVSHFLLLR